ncbi:phosphatase [Terrimonas sp.]|uniref:phosphatase n=1 Tax=Terrimonas sp. TaxID=1914338 RepID=UPI000D51D42B|nr:phosphatase [Terrimonas sp.]PVD52967.1 phosphatase [Terrimonas sp.]
MHTYSTSDIPFEHAVIDDYKILNHKIQNVKAFVFDWDGVFNDGRKDIEGQSSFSEIDAMGVNMMRFSYFLRYGVMPVTAIITGENNPLAFSFAKREHFHSVFYKEYRKEDAMIRLCEKFALLPSETLFVFDDVLDLSAAMIAGVRCMVGRSANPLLLQFVRKFHLADYITQHDGGNYAVRETSEIFMMLSGNFEQTIRQRTEFSETYQHYIKQRNEISTDFFSTNHNHINLTIVGK